MKIPRSIKELYAEAEELGIPPQDHIAMEYWGEVTDKTCRMAKDASFCYLYGGDPPGSPTAEAIDEVVAKFKKQFPAFGALHKPLPNVQASRYGKSLWLMTEEEFGARYKVHHEFRQEWGNVPYVPPKPQGPSAEIKLHEEAADRLYPPGSEAGGCWSSEELRQDEEDRLRAMDAEREVDAKVKRDIRDGLPEENKTVDCDKCEHPAVPHRECGSPDPLYPHQREMIELFYDHYYGCPFMDMPDANKTGKTAYIDYETAGEPIVFHCGPFKPLTPPQEKRAEDRMRRVGVTTHRIRVFQDDGSLPSDYNIRAASELDARCIAFALDGGCGDISDFDDGHIELAITWTRVLV